MTAIIIGCGTVTDLIIKLMGTYVAVSFSCGTPTAQKFEIYVLNGQKEISHFQTSKTGVNMFRYGERVEFFMTQIKNDTLAKKKPKE